MTYTRRQSLFAKAWASITGDDEFAREERMHLRHAAMEDKDIAEVYRDLTGYSPAVGEITADAWAIGRKGIRARLHGGSIKGHSGPVRPVFRSVMALNDAVVACANSRLARPHGQLTEAIKERLGLWTMPMQYGSIVIDMVAPPAEFSERDRKEASERDTPFPALEDLQTPTEQSVDEVFSVLDAVIDFRNRPDQLEQHLVGMGPETVRELKRFAQRCEELAATIDLDNRVQIDKILKFTPADAAYLHSTIRTLRLDERPVTLEGTWGTASLERAVFDLVVPRDDGLTEKVSGTVPRSLMAESAAAFNKWVQIEFREIRSGADDEHVRRILERISVLGERDPRGH